MKHHGYETPKQAPLDIINEMKHLKMKHKQAWKWKIKVKLAKKYFF